MKGKTKKEDGDGGVELYYYFNDQVFEFSKHPINTKTNATSVKFDRDAVMTTRVDTSSMRTEDVWAKLEDSYLMSDSGNNYQVEKAEFVLNLNYGHKWKTGTTNRQYRSVNSNGKSIVTDDTTFYKTTTLVFTPGAIGNQSLPIKINLRAHAKIEKSSLAKNFREKADKTIIKGWSPDNDDPDYAAGKTAGDKIYFAKVLTYINVPETTLVSADSATLFADVNIYSGSGLEGGYDKSSYCVGDIEDASDPWIRTAGSQEPTSFKYLNSDSNLSTRQYSEWDWSTAGDENCISQNSSNSCLNNQCTVKNKPCPGAIYTEWVNATEKGASATLRCYYPSDDTTIKSLEDKTQGSGDNDNTIYKQLRKKYCNLAGTSFDVVAAGATKYMSRN